MAAQGSATRTGRLTALENRFLDWIRSPRANEVARTTPTGSIDDLRGRKYCVLVTYRRNGDAIPSPLWFGVGDGKVYAHTMGVKVKRIQANPRVLVAPSTFRGRPTGPPFEGNARVVDADASAAADRVIQANYGWVRTLYYRLTHQAEAGVYIEVEPTPPR
jgi:PPOX class probable F420-dependent enzyme